MTHFWPREEKYGKFEQRWLRKVGADVTQHFAMASLLDEELNEKLQIGGHQAAKKSFPLKNIQVAALIDGVHTEFILTKYANCLFVIVTQTEKLGTIVSIFSGTYLS